MSEHGFYAFARHTAVSVSGRRSLIALGGAALAASLASPAHTTAKRGGKGKNRCKPQVAKCREGVADLCLLTYGQDAAECVELYADCCRFLQNCETAKAFACVAEKIPA